MKAKLPAWLTKEIGLPRKRTARSPFARRIHRVLKVLGLVVLCWFVLWRIVLYREINSRFARLHTAGLPTSGTELNAWLPAVPNPENGALVLTQAFALIRTFTNQRSNQVAEASILFRTNTWSPALRELVEAYVHTNQLALAKAREGLLHSRFRYPTDFGYGPETELPHLGPLKALARIAALQAALEAEQGRTDAWPESVTLVLKLAGTLDDEPSVISHLLRNTVIRMAARSVERSLNRATSSDEALKELQEAFAQITKSNSWPMALAGERAIMIPTFRLSWQEIQNLSREDEPGSLPRKAQRYSGKATFFLWLSGLLERDLNFFLETMEKSISLAASPPPQNLELTNYIESASKVADKRYYILTGLFLPALSRATVREASSQALSELAYTTLTVERYRLKEGHLPSTLEKLAPNFLPEVPRDPFDGAPLRYHLLEHGYVIYSVDADGKDDGGKEGPEHKKSTDHLSYDITFTVER